MHTIEFCSFIVVVNSSGETSRIVLFSGGNGALDLRTASTAEVEAWCVGLIHQPVKAAPLVEVTDPIPPGHLYLIWKSA